MSTGVKISTLKFAGSDMLAYYCIRRPSWLTAARELTTKPFSPYVDDETIGEKKQIQRERNVHSLVFIHYTRLICMRSYHSLALSAMA